MNRRQIELEALGQSGLLLFQRNLAKQAEAAMNRRSVERLAEAQAINSHMSGVINHLWQQARPTHGY